MDPIAVTAALLRAQLPDVPIREGASLMARVASRGETHAVIVIAGLPVTAKLPPEVEAGAVLKLKVKEVTAERVTMQIDQPPQTAANLQTPVIGQATPQAHLQGHVEVEEPPVRQPGRGRRARRRRLAGVHAPDAGEARPAPGTARRSAHPGRSDDRRRPAPRRRFAGF